MSSDDAKPAAPKTLGSLDIDFHESTHSRNFQKAYSTRRLVTNRHDDLLRSGSTHQLLNRPFSSSTIGEGVVPSSLLTPPPPGGPPAPAGAAESLATEDTAQESESEDDGSELSFCDASGDQAADREYLRKDLGASLHDDELDFESGDELDKKGGDGEDDDLIANMKNRMKLDEEAAKEKEAASS